MTSTVSAPSVPIMRRDRILVLSSLFGITALAWLAAFRLGAGLDMLPNFPPELALRLAVLARTPAFCAPGADIKLTFAMWLVMMVAMMAPSVSPTLMMYSRILRARAHPPLARAAVFLLGYLAVWSLFSAAATLAQSALNGILLGTAFLSGVLLVAAGIFQFTPLKNACLTRCRSPQGFFVTEWREGARGALVMGLKSGQYCLGCCWLLMGVLVATGAMNIFWMPVITVYVLIEKLVPAGPWLGRAAGLALVAAGGWIAMGAI